MPNDTEATRAEIEKRLREATPGPWKVERRFSNGCEIIPRITCAHDDDRGCGWIADCVGAPYLGHKTTLPNAELIANCPTDLRYLLDSLTASEAELSRLRKLVPSAEMLATVEAALQSARQGMPWNADKFDTALSTITAIKTGGRDNA